MAEARVATSSNDMAVRQAEKRVDPLLREVQFGLAGDGVVLFLPHPRYLVQNWRRSLWRTTNKVRAAFFPAPLSVIVLTISGALVKVLRFSNSDSWWRNGWLANLLWKIDSFFPWTKRLPINVRVGYLCMNFSLLVLMTFMFIQRRVLRKLLAWHGYMDRKNADSFKTKVWGFLLKYVYLRAGHKGVVLTGYQSVLPTLPLPKLNDTFQRFLEFTKLRYTANKLPMTEYDKIAADCEVFLKNQGPKLQDKLWWWWLINENYVTDFWVWCAYLRYRKSLMISSNYYGIGHGRLIPSNNQLHRAAYSIHKLVKLSQEVYLETFEPLVPLAGGSVPVPVCMKQYTSMFGTARLPYPSMDKLRHYQYEETRHVIVSCKGLWYRLPVYTLDHRRRLLSPHEIVLFLEYITRDAEGQLKNYTEEERQYNQQMAALTALHRDEWTKVRNSEFLGVERNRQSIKMIERALFSVVLWDPEKPQPENWTQQAHMLMHGLDGSVHWCDKSFNYVVFANGRSGIHAEHTWADAPVLGHIVEILLANELQEEPYKADGTLKDPTRAQDKLRVSNLLQYLQEDHQDDPHSPRAIKNERLAAELSKEAREAFDKRMQAEYYVPVQMKFDLTSRLKKAITSSLQQSKVAIDNLELNVKVFCAYGKNVPKAAKCGPDAWIQMALQLAFFRDQKKFTHTYESGGTRLFVGGRTETIRSFSPTSYEWVITMEDPTKTPEQKFEALKIACDAHQRYAQAASSGKGIDRHIFALYIVSCSVKATKEEDMSSPFLDDIFADQKWTLSTSQIPAKQTDIPYPHGDDGSAVYSASGGFAPVDDQGYGVCYCLQGEHKIMFHVSSMKRVADKEGNLIDAPRTTDSVRFQQTLRKVLIEMADLAIGAGKWVNMEFRERDIDGTYQEILTGPGAKEGRDLEKVVKGEEPMLKPLSEEQRKIEDTMTGADKKKKKGAKK